MMNASRFYRPLGAALLTAALAIGCAAPRFASFPQDRTKIELARSAEDADVRSLPMFAGSDGSPLRWDDLLAAADWAHIIIVGEQHDDSIGHAVQLAIVEDVPRLGALSIEMLERDEQMLADDYIEDIIDAETFIRLTHSANWSGEGSWERWYQPIVDAAKNRNARLVAANTPRRYVRLPRLYGYQRLRQLSPQRQKMFDLPRASDRALAAYRERFYEVMRHGHGESTDDAREPNPHRVQQIDAGLRSQLLWDATMADSIVRAQPGDRAKVVHLVGQFHSDFEGGLVQEIRARKPLARILNISMQREWRDTMRDADRGRADIIIYTGERPEPEDDEPNDVETADEHE